MSEHAPKEHNPERGHESGHEDSAEQRERLNNLIEQAKETKEKSHQEIAHLAHEAKEKALSKERSATEIGKETHKPNSAVIDKTVKQQAYKKTIKHVQRQLPRSQRTFSKLIHQDTVEKVSEVSSKTIARPSGLLGSGVFAFLGTTVVVWVSRHYGFRYNFSTFVAFVLVGFFVGLMAELLLSSGKKLLRRS